MTLTLALWFALSITCDVFGQICFKLGVDRLPDARGPDKAGFWRGLLVQPWLLTGILIYAVEIFIWLRILSEADLTLAFPIASANFLGIVLASRIFLKEEVRRRQWIGAWLVTIGVAIVAATD
jgi:undecaprenyl phosphate-alpha-L-ara4N flippase subunit ArnE